MKCKYENKNGTCGLKGSYAYRHKCFTEDLCKCFEPLSNADRIRSMSDVDLANFIGAVATKDWEFRSLYGGYSAALDWLRQPAETEENL